MKSDELDWGEYLDLGNNRLNFPNKKKLSLYLDTLAEMWRHSAEVLESEIGETGDPNNNRDAAELCNTLAELSYLLKNWNPEEEARLLAKVSSLAHSIPQLSTHGLTQTQPEFQVEDNCDVEVAVDFDEFFTALLNYGPVYFDVEDLDGQTQRYKALNLRACEAIMDRHEEVRHIQILGPELDQQRRSEFEKDKT